MPTGVYERKKRKTTEGALDAPKRRGGRPKGSKTRKPGGARAADAATFQIVFADGKPVIQVVAGGILYAEDARKLAAAAEALEAA